MIATVVKMVCGASFKTYVTVAEECRPHGKLAPEDEAMPRLIRYAD
jgi:hypothetical protein